MTSINQIRKIVIGPRSIFPPTNNATQEWLDLAFRLTIHDYSLSLLKSTSIYIDATTNRLSNFLDTIVRTTTYSFDHNNKMISNSVEITYGNIFNIETVNREILRFQKISTFPPYVISGLPLNNNFPEINIHEPYYDCEVFITNGIQKLKFHSPKIPEKDYFNNIFTIFDLLQSQTRYISPIKWKERFNSVESHGIGYIDIIIGEDNGIFSVNPVFHRKVEREAGGSED